MAIGADLIETASAILEEWANEATQSMVNNLQRSGIDQSSALSQSIKFDGTQVTPTGITVKWAMPDYAVFVDMGVRGLQNRAKVYGNFAFRNMHVSYKFLTSLESWVSKKGIRVRESRSDSQQSVFDRRKQIAYAIGKSIKKKGISGNQFYSDVFNDKGFKDLTDKLQAALGQEIEVRLIKPIFPS